MARLKIISVFRDELSLLVSLPNLKCLQVVNYDEVRPEARSDRALERYNLSASERFAYESSFRQCLRCEALLSEFREARESELARVAGHLVTPVLADEV